MNDFFATNSGYREFLTELTRRVQSARVTAGRAVNRELVTLYWDIGRSIVEKQRTQGWGNAVVEKLGTDLRREFPGVTGFSADNLWRMRQFYLEGTNADFLALLDPSVAGPFLEQAVPEIGEQAKSGILEQAVPERQIQTARELMALVPWGHHVELMKKVKSPDARLFYLREIARFGWSRAVFLHQIKASTFERSLREKKTHNFELALPDGMAEQAEEMLKSRYNLEFLGLTRAVKERELEDRLVTRLQQFILELGYGFCFVGRQYRLALEKKEYFVDLLFYHRFLKTLVAFDLKIGAFEPEHAGKMVFI